MNKIGLILIILVLVGAGIFLLGNNNKQANKNISTTPMPTVNQATGNENATEATVTVANSGFEPQSLTVKIGTKVVWMNKSGAEATVNSAQHPTHLVYPPLNLGQFAQDSSVSLVFDKPGEYKYHNHLNPTQFGSITVE